MHATIDVLILFLPRRRLIDSPCLNSSLAASHIIFCDDDLNCFFRFAEKHCLEQQCERDNEQEMLSSLPVGGDRSNALASAVDQRCCHVMCLPAWASSPS
jgi:hypothetical protein